MAYIINLTNGTQLTSVEDGTIDLRVQRPKLVGKNYAGYGEIQNENFVHLLENFPMLIKSQVPSWQIWFDSAVKKLKFYDGTKSPTTGGAEVSMTITSWINNWRLLVGYN